jgi:DNA polymerase
MNYQEFEEAKIKCTSCFIGKYYNVVVPSDGCKTNPIVLIVGEAPGISEVEFLKPFVGKSGKLLRATLNQFGYRKSNSLITNVLPCRPESNEFPKDNSLVMSCVHQWLLKEIEITKPKFMLLIGATPTRFLLLLTGITNLRGKWVDYNGIPCMPTYHPSYVQRKEHMEEGKQIKEDFLSDIKMVAEKAGFIR